MFFLIFVLPFIVDRPVETGRTKRELQTPRFLLKLTEKIPWYKKKKKVDLLPIKNNSEKKKIAKEYKTFQILRKFLITLLLSTSCNIKIYLIEFLPFILLFFFIFYYANYHIETQSFIKPYGYKPWGYMPWVVMSFALGIYAIEAINYVFSINNIFKN